jgi:hypothetical protein
LLEGVEAVRDLCKQVEPVEVPEGLCERILQATVLAEKAQTRRAWAWVERRISRLKLSLRGFARPLLTPELVTAAIICLATFGFLLVDFSDDRTVEGIYRQASIRTAKLFSSTGEIAAGKEKAVLGVEKVKEQISSLIKAGIALVSDQPDEPSPQKTDEQKGSQEKKEQPPATPQPEK